MEKTYLAQRLSRVSPPWVGDIPCVIKGSQIDLKLMQEVRPKLWSYDYMGAAEYEFGAIAESLVVFAAKPLGAFSFKIPFAKVSAPMTMGAWEKKKGKKGKETYVVPELPKNMPPVVVHVICGLGEKEDARENIVGIATGNARVKQGAYFEYAAYAPHVDERYLDFSRGLGGWFEETNAFWFFVDEEMYKNACKLFGVKP